MIEDCFSFDFIDVQNTIFKPDASATQLIFEFVQPGIAGGFLGILSKLTTAIFFKRLKDAKML